MSGLKYVQFEPLELTKREYPEYDERWVQSLIAADPSILGLGKQLVLRDKERAQPKAGRLDLLLQDRETDRRFEVEVQLGDTDPSHIIRTIEYWDIERRRYPQYDHTAVIVAENITARFLNVISLFNGFIPLVAIQMKAMKCGDTISLVFTTVLNQMILGREEDEEEVEGVTRQDWEGWATPETVALTDQLLELIHTFAPAVRLNYTTAYVGLAQDGRPNNFLVFVPQKKTVSMEVFYLDQSDDLENQMAERRIAYTLTKNGSYKVKLLKADVEEHTEFLAALMRTAWNERNK